MLTHGTRKSRVGVDDGHHLFSGLCSLHFAVFLFLDCFFGNFQLDHLFICDNDMSARGPGVAMFGVTLEGEA